jgi:hypothetical protein
VSAEAWVLRLLFGLACAGPLLCWPSTGTGRPRWGRWVLALVMAGVSAAWYPDGPFLNRVDGQLLGGPACRF